MAVVKIGPSSILIRTSSERRALGSREDADYIISLIEQPCGNVELLDGSREVGARARVDLDGIRLDVKLRSVGLCGDRPVSGVHLINRHKSPCPAMRNRYRHAILLTSRRWRGLAVETMETRREI